VGLASSLAKTDCKSASFGKFTIGILILIKIMMMTFFQTKKKLHLSQAATNFLNSKKLSQQQYSSIELLYSKITAPLRFFTVFI
jgi:hypothetical protein